MEEKRIVEIIKVNGGFRIKAKCKFCGVDYTGSGFEFCSKKCARKYAFKDRKWGNGLTACVNCGRSDRPHWAHGLCEGCKKKHKTYLRGEQQYWQHHKKELMERRKPYLDRVINGGYRQEILKENCRVCGKEAGVVFHLDRKGYRPKKDGGEINNSRKNQVALCKRDLARVNFGFVNL